MSFLSKSSKPASSRRQIAIKEVRDGILVLPGNEHRLAMQLSSVNFELMSESEQDALIDTYQDFLNSLDTQLQILVRVREMDMDRYIEDFTQKVSDETQQVYKDQIAAYAEFVRSLVATNKIMSRQFYVVIPHTGSETDFAAIKERMEVTADMIAKGVNRLGMGARTLDSLELLDLFYGFYSPAKAKRQPLGSHTLDMLSGERI